MKQYGQDPIIEAICEFHFDPSFPCDLAVPGLMYRDLESHFPERRQCKIHNQTIESTPKGPRATIQVIDRMQFFNANGTALVQTNPHFLSVNHLKPYPQWSHFLPMVKQGLDAYCQAARPGNIVQVGLHYINRIEIPGNSAHLPDYFNFHPIAINGLPSNFKSCILGITAVVPEHGGELRMQLANGPGNDQLVHMILDLDHRLHDLAGISIDDALLWIGRAHKYLVSVFELCITDNTRALFGKPDE